MPRRSAGRPCTPSRRSTGSSCPSRTARASRRSPTAPTKGPPAYGLLGLAELPGDWGGEAAERDLGKPFPLTEAWLWEEDEGEDDAERDAAVDRVLLHGSVVLGTDGCAMDWHLVVSGPHRGHVWQVTDVGALPFGAEFGHTTATSGFTGWVRHWAAGKEWFDAPGT